MLIKENDFRGHYSFSEEEITALEKIKPILFGILNSIENLKQVTDDSLNWDKISKKLDKVQSQPESY